MRDRIVPWERGERSSDASVKTFRADFGVDQLNNNPKRRTRCAKGISCPFLMVAVLSIHTEAETPPGNP